MSEAWLPLEGLRVVDFSMFVPGPFAAAILADLGADVIKVESPAGDPARRYIPVQFRTENRNKRSLAIDLKASASAAVVERLAQRADIVLEGFRPGVAKRLGIDGERLRAANPRLITCSISGYGQSGPWREHPGHDVGYVAAAGALAFPGQWLEPPARSSLPIADMGEGRSPLPRCSPRCTNASAPAAGCDSTCRCSRRRSSGRRCATASRPASTRELTSSR